MKKNLIILFLIHMYSHSFAQVNLVPNPSFENYSSCPTSSSQLYKATPWYTPTGDTPDYFNVCGVDSLGFVNPGVPLNFWGYQNARTGSAYAGFGMYNNTDEYVSVRLDSSLVAGKKYCVEFYLSLNSFAKYSTSSIGVYFSDTSLTDYSIITYLPVTPQVINPLDRFLSDTANWMRVSGNYNALGGEQYITIGNFMSGADMPIDTTYPGNIDYVTYYYIDDVSVTECPNTPIEPTENLSIPTLLSGEQFIEIKGLLPNSELRLYNTLGQIIYKNTNYSNNFNTINLQTGVYYYYLKAATGELHKGKILIVN